MNAPLIWIFLPFFLGIFLMVLKNQKLIVLVATVICILLAISAFLLQIDSALTIGNLNLRIAPDFEVLGRRLIIPNSDRSLLVLIYGASAFWFAVASSIKVSRRLIPYGLAITSLLVAALAVEPFLYAALLIEVAVLLSIPLVSASNQKPGKGVLRFLIYQTLAMPFILFSGWLLTGIEATPGNLASVTNATAMLGLGFAFLLAVFPFYTWIPLLAEEVHPYVAGFVLWIFLTTTIFFGLGFLDRYAWLRDSSSLGIILTTVGLIMVISSGILFMFQRHLSRMMGYAVIFENGFSLIALGLGGEYGLNSFLLLFIPRLVSLALWAYALSVLHAQSPILVINNLQGMARKWPFATAGVLLAALSIAGLPLLAAFPGHQAIWMGAAQKSLSISIWILLGSLGMTIGAIRILTYLLTSIQGSSWSSLETWPQRIFLSLGWLILLLFGLFPQLASFLWIPPPVPN